MRTYLLHNSVQTGDVGNVELLINQGADLNELDEFGNSPLHWAVMGGYYDIVKILLEAGANPNVLSTDGYSPKWSAVDWGLVEITDLLNSYDGKVITNDHFDRTSWNLLKKALGQSLPEEE
ncbi:ankyrin repeat domain-containing protein [Mucilaginibacter aquaedulcis]|uniref:ankyrin repeat domain-containing protein n=1 Tax=Mucilaginibacter aquaedulcis TaxID=1187081 RepID=UPI0025B46375|nr:ankyrin repeat domain-containing protein [Mucilaginibacter aquaedulcis]MDN3549296.1 ankyrin repeat domain-containing protein [Mucilaginibacter aquaedulcis]